ncbi:MAG: glycosyl hydrolase family 18 protein, partial [Synergistaceae bacterium]|nr:glycosyl hydrolase family 18 protein [Synergistaceae bacterium]
NVSGLEKLTGCFVETSNGLPCVRIRPKEIAAFPAKSTTGLQKPIILAWEYVTSYSPELAQEPVISGLDVISPTWFNLTESSGLVSNRVSPSYAGEAHRRGMKIWALVSNSFNGQMTKEFLKNEKARKLFIAQLLAFSKLYGLDGFNFDFERVDVADRDAFTQLLREAAPYLKEAGLVVSVDVHKPANTNMSKSHDRKALGSVVDYVMVMAYDQHWSSCPTAGSVADLPWTKHAVHLTLQEGVPAEKLLLGIPFYMRRWQCTPLAGGKEKVKGATLTMEQSDELIRKHKLTPVWLDDKKQDYYEFKENGQIIKVWVENAKSLAERAALIKEFNLAGAACWRKGHEQPYAWKALTEQLLGNSGK